MGQAPDEVKEPISGVCLELSAKCGSVIREVGNTIRKMKKSSTIDILMGEMNGAAQELQDVLRSYPITKLHSNNNSPSSHDQNDDATTTPTKSKTQQQLVLVEVMQLVTVASLLIEIVARVEGIVHAVQQLADSARFLPVPDTKTPTQRRDPEDEDPCSQA